MSPIQLLKESWSLYKENWKIMTAIFVFPSFFVYLGAALVTIHNVALIIIGVLASIIGAILSVTMQPAAINLVHRIDSGDTSPVSIKGQYIYGFKLFWSVIFLAIISILVGMGSAILFVIPAIVISVYTCMNTLSLVLDGKKGFAALLESYSVVKGRWWKVFGRLLFVVLVYIVASLVFAGLRLILDSIFGFGINSFGDFTISGIVSFVLSMTLGPIFLVYIYKFYKYLKETRLPDVSTVVFKRWLVAFIVIGILFLISLPFVAIGLIGAATRDVSIVAPIVTLQ